MKVMCITDEWSCLNGLTYQKDPSYGEICIVKETRNNQLGKFLKLIGYEYDLGRPNWYLETGFIPISDIDEMELINKLEEVEN